MASNDIASKFGTPDTEELVEEISGMISDIKDSIMTGNNNGKTIARIEILQIRLSNYKAETGGE